jgi:hypothetical protein
VAKPETDLVERPSSRQAPSVNSLPWERDQIQLTARVHRRLCNGHAERAEERKARLDFSRDKRDLIGLLWRAQCTGHKREGAPIGMPDGVRACCTP